MIVTGIIFSNYYWSCLCYGYLYLCLRSA